MRTALVAALSLIVSAAVPPAVYAQMHRTDARERKSGALGAFPTSFVGAEQGLRPRYRLTYVPASTRGTYARQRSLRPARVHAQTQPGIQQVFLGQIDCGLAPSNCLYPNQLVTHRYLHVIVHDLAGNPDWQVRAGPDCTATNTVIAGGVPIGANGYLEQVIDLSTYTSGGNVFAGCLSFEGRSGYAVYYYAAWFDDNPAPEADVLYPGYAALGGQPAIADLDVMYIHRTPSIAFDDPLNLPIRGQLVTYQAQVENSGLEPALGFDYVWTLDGKAVSRGQISAALAPRADIVVDFPWRWAIGPHTLRFQLSPHSADRSASNDQLEIRTDALTLGFWVERSAYTYFSQHQFDYCADKPCAGSNSFTDWLERQVSTWNAMMAHAVYPDFAPGGVADRVRVDAIHVVPDGSLPLAGNESTDSPDTRDHSVDLEWGLPAAGVENTYRLRVDRAFDIDWAQIHELGHARYLTDLYRFDAPTNSTVSIDVHAVDGRSAVDPANPLDAAAPLHAFMGASDAPFYYQDPEQDLMSCTCIPTYSAYTALTLNRIRGQRARCGNFNTPCNIGEWFADIPTDTRLRIEDRVGGPLPSGAKVRLFFDAGTGYTGHRFTDSNSLSLAVEHGEIDLGSDPFRSRTSAAYRPQHTLLIEIRALNVDTFCFLEPTSFNMAYWLGYRDRGHPALLTIRLGGQQHNACNPVLPDPLVNEPFAVSPVRSLAQLAPPSRSRGRTTQVLTVHLVGDGPAHDPMANRVVIALNPTGQTVGQGTTSRTGITHFVVPRGQVATVVDQTDNNLVIASAGGSALPLRVQRR